MAKNVKGASFRSSSFIFRPTAMSAALAGLVSAAPVFKREPAAMVTHRRPNDTLNVRPSTVTVL